jgi:methionyl-tRNA formyltransferase
VAQPRSLRLDGKYPRTPPRRAPRCEPRADVMVVAAYGLILPQWVLDLPRLGCLNIHASLLPRWRGAAPIHRAIEAGDAETGVTIMQMDAGLDTGDMLLASASPSRRRHHRHAARQAGRAGRPLIVEALELAACGGLQPVPQPAEGVTYAHKIEKAEAAIDWSQPAERSRGASAPSIPSRRQRAARRRDREVLAARALPARQRGARHHRRGRRPASACLRRRAGCDHRTAARRRQAPAAADFLRGFALQPGMRFEA